MPLRTHTTIARKLRHESTDAERLLWRALHGLPWKFRRQHPIGRHVVDFACPSHRLAIGIDGGQHADRTAEDAARTEELARHGYRVIRFWNNEVMGNLDGVLESIVRAIEVSPSSP